MGYVALRTKAKARSCVVAVMPSLQNEQNILRQWTVRCASEDAHFCFISSFSHVQLPQITEDDLYDEKRPPSNPLSNVGQNYKPVPRQYPQFNMPPPVSAVRSPPPVRPRQIDFDMPSLDDMSYERSYSNNADMTTSMSMDVFPHYDNWGDSMAFETPSFDWEPSEETLATKQMTRSTSAYIGTIKDFDISDDF